MNYYQNLKLIMCIFFDIDKQTLFQQLEEKPDWARD